MANAIPLHVKSLIQAVSTPACPASQGGLPRGASVLGCEAQLQDINIKLPR